MKSINSLHVSTKEKEARYFCVSKETLPNALDEPDEIIVISKAADIADRKKLVGLLALTLAAILCGTTPSLVRAEEGGTGHHLPGSGVFLTGVLPAEPGFTVRVSDWFYVGLRGQHPAALRHSAKCRADQRRHRIDLQRDQKWQCAVAAHCRHSGGPASGARPSHRREPCPGLRAKHLHHHAALRIAMEAARHAGGDGGFPAVSLRQDDRHGGGARPEADKIRAHSGGRLWF